MLVECASRRKPTSEPVDTTTHPQLLDEWSLMLRHINVPPQAGHPWERLTKREVFRWVADATDPDTCRSRPPSSASTHALGLVHGPWTGLAPSLRDRRVCFACRSAARSLSGFRVGEADQTQYVEVLLRDQPIRRQQWLENRRGDWTAVLEHSRMATGLSWGTLSPLTCRSAPIRRMHLELAQGVSRSCGHRDLMRALDAMPTCIRGSPVPAMRGLQDSAVLAVTEAALRDEPRAKSLGVSAATQPSPRALPTPSDSRFLNGYL